MDHDQFRQMSSYVNDTIKKRAYEMQASRIGKITVVKSGQRYDIETADGDRTFEDIPNTVPGIKWRVGQWVVMEYSGLGFAIVGSSPTAAGS